MLKLITDFQREWHISQGVSEQALDDFAEGFVEHVRYVQEAGRKLNVPEGQLRVHDTSKLSLEEYGAYAQHYFGGGAPEAFSYAWLHHIHQNEHHWQHFIYADGFTLQGSTTENGVLRMPNRFILEMVADWMGASKIYTGSWDMEEWLLNNIPAIRVHGVTAVFLRRVLSEQGYASVIESTSFQGESL